MHLRPVLDRPAGGKWRFDGFVGERLKAAVESWLLPAPRANPSMLQMFRDRDRKPTRKLVPWAGEFVGKHLTASVLVWEVTRDPRLFEATKGLVRELISVQDADGYLGPHPRSERLVGKTVEGHRLWDVWGHYHGIVGLLLWHGQTKDEAALQAARKAGDLICRTFLDANRPLTDAGAEEMNMAIIHAMCLLYERTGEARYLQMAQRVEKDWELPSAGDYLRAGLAGTEFHLTRKPRWESLHDLLALPELYWITGDGRYRQAFEHFWWSILKGDRHNTGGFTSGEQAVGNPYATGAIETCCTVAWIAMSVEMLRMTGDPRVADEIELSTLNGAIGGQHPCGRWWTYNTPMDGVKLASAHEIVFQAHPGGPELNCCSV
ncbi:MAG TPA: beta-L-arabinofuranosidase domain-containing protein, partial [Armatimonadota bacterium]|nr:beta-L-arabinofuranosidase domain-containing protein [Armatimonadota bacterium]